jgi:hypothetical protein
VVIKAELDEWKLASCLVENVKIGSTNHAEQMWRNKRTELDRAEGKLGLATVQGF